MYRCDLQFGLKSVMSNRDGTRKHSW